ncbi:ribonuclease HII [Membranihabitans marinus]|uniref:ribonuclease HII n=1 Tax=Membranihabitans marinus TaxID=1227546 RepID=UPI001F01D37C|nr:ribonuclease HII [Membranihabitans marinus]
MALILHNHHKDRIVAGLDEAGRGCLAGPVTAAAVILPPNFQNSILDDSKKVSGKNREILRKIIEKQAIAYGVGFVSPKRIDEINILNASFEAMHLAIEQLTIKPQLLIIDGNRFNQYKNIDHQCIVKGDSIYYSIAAASILAKTYRDEYMTKEAEKYPNYDWKQNKGYPTKRHKSAIAIHGSSPLHRLSFKW